MALWLGLGAFSARGPASAPRWGTEIPRTTPCGQQQQQNLTCYHRLGIGAAGLLDSRSVNVKMDVLLVVKGAIKRHSRTEQLLIKT